MGLGRSLARTRAACGVIDETPILHDGPARARKSPKTRMGQSYRVEGSRQLRSAWHMARSMRLKFMDYSGLHRGHQRVYLTVPQEAEPLP